MVLPGESTYQYNKQKFQQNKQNKSHRRQSFVCMERSPIPLNNVGNQKNSGSFKRIPGRKAKEMSPVRPPSPPIGSEEYIKRKVAETSPIIMQRILNPNASVTEKETPKTDEKNPIEETVTTQPATEIQQKSNPSDRPNRPKKVYNFQELESKILKHITNLDNGRMKNLINATTSSFDSHFQEMHKRQRLELSSLLRQMVSSKLHANSGANNIWNTIIPDLGIDVEELPTEFIEKLSETLDLDLSNNEKENIDDSSQETAFPTTFPSHQIVPKIEPLELLSDDVDETSNLLCTEDVKFDSQYEVGDTRTGSDISDFNMHSSVDNTTQTLLAGPHIQPYHNDHLLNNLRVQIKTEHASFTSEIVGTITVRNNTQTQMIESQVQTDLNGEYESCINSPSNRSQSHTEKANVATQVDPPVVIDRSQQTEKLELFSEIKNSLLKKYNGVVPVNHYHCVDIMYEVDDLVKKLTEFRQTLFDTRKSNSKPKNVSKRRETCYHNSPKKKRFDERHAKPPKNENRVELPNQAKKPELAKTQDNSVELSVVNERHAEPSKDENRVELPNQAKETEMVKTQDNSVELSVGSEILKFPLMDEEVLQIQVEGEDVIISTKGGKILYFSMRLKCFFYTLNVTDVAITSLRFTTVSNSVQMFVGTLDPVLRVYDNESKQLLRSTVIKEGAQCMDIQWNYVFIGGSKGSLMRYSIKNSKLESNDKFSNEEILALKATQEGARRILLIGCRNCEVYVRDAMSGLFMRALLKCARPQFTVHSLLYGGNTVFCGTRNNILAISFYDGSFTHILKSPCKIISSLKMYKNLLLASCYNGIIYIFDMKNHNTIAGTITASSEAILTMEVVKSQIIVSTKETKIDVIAIPDYILKKIV